MRVNSLSSKGRQMSIAVAFTLALGVGFAVDSGVAQARTLQQATTHEAAVATEVSAARRQRRARRSVAPDNANASTAQPPSNSNFGYGVGDNSRYGGG